MPELPEVEAIARRLRDGGTKEKKLVGRTVTGARVPSAKALKEPARATFAKKLAGARFTGVRRRAKRLVLDTDRGALLVHLKLTGDLHVLPKGAEEPRFLRVALDLDDGSTLAFTDARHLGEVRFVDDAAPYLDDLGPEPLSDELTLDAFAKLMAGKRAVKAVLMDQSVIAGVGNIYSDEACFLAKIWPGRPAGKLARDDVKRLHGAVRKALQASIDELTRDDDIAWRYQNRTKESPFFVYDRAGEKCRKCGTTLKSAKIAGRTTVFCPKCQPK